MSPYEERLREDSQRYQWLKMNLPRLGSEYMTAARLRELTGSDLDRMCDEGRKG